MSGPCGGRCPAPEGSEPPAVKGRMNKTPAPHAGRHTRPLLVRAAHTWYAWAGLGLTAAGAYFAANGQLRVGDGAHLRAADPVNWKPAAPPSTGEGSTIVLTPATDPDDPFRAAPADPKPAAKESMPKLSDAKPANTKQSDKMAGQGSNSPDPFVAADVKPVLAPKAGAALNAYVNDKDVVPAKAEQPSAPPNITAPKLVIPPAPPAVTGPSLPAMTATPKSTFGVSPTGPAPIPPGTFGVKLPPIPPPPAAPTIPAGGIPASKPMEPALPNTLVAQEPEILPVKPRPVDKGPDAGTEAPAEKKEPPPPKKRKIIGTLSQDDEIKLNAAQTEARLKNF